MAIGALTNLLTNLGASAATTVRLGGYALKHLATASCCTPYLTRLSINRSYRTARKDARPNDAKQSSDGVKPRKRESREGKAKGTKLGGVKIGL
jgi:hypothetical protein